MSNKVFVVASEKGSGTMYTAEYAFKLAKPLGCFVEPSGKESPAGNIFLVDSNMASAVCDTDELMEFVGRPEYSQMSLFG